MFTFRGMDTATEGVCGANGTSELAHECSEIEAIRLGLKESDEDIGCMWF